MKNHFIVSPIRLPKRVCWMFLTSICLLLAGFGTFSSTAFAATTNQAQANLAASKVAPAFAATTGSPTNPATAKLASSYVSVDTISEPPAVSGNASNPCKTVTFQRNYTGAGITIAWLKMVTTWCYNNVIVTSHSTILSWGVTAFGSGLGWYIQHSTPNYSFNCYVASGSTRNCSGNHEAAKQFWRNGSAGVGLALTVNESEAYKGQASASGGTQNCVGSCA